MIRPTIFAVIALLATSVLAGSTTSTVPTDSKNSSIQEMLVSGNPDMKLHALEVIEQKKITIDEFFLPGLKICATDSSTAVRKRTARLIGQNMIADNETPNTDAVAIIMELARDQSTEVRYDAIYYGLSQLEKKSDEVIGQLIDAAATTRERSLYDRALQALIESPAQAKRVIDNKLETDFSTQVYDLYDDVTGIKPPSMDKYRSQQAITIQDVLLHGNSKMRLHSLGLISQGKVQGSVDDSYLPGFQACARDSATPVRSITAKIVGQFLIKDIPSPNPDAIDLMINLANDDSEDVRYSAVYYGLTLLKNMSDEVVLILIKEASSRRGDALYERIANSLNKSSEQVSRLLDKKLAQGEAVLMYEIYNDMTGEKPTGHSQYLNMPSSRPRMFVFQGDDGDPKAFQSKLEAELKATGIENTDVQISGFGDSYVLLLTTHLVKDYLAVEEHFTNHDQFKITQDMWLTPELEIQINDIRKPY